MHHAGTLYTATFPRSVAYSPQSAVLGLYSHIEKIQGLGYLSFVASFFIFFFEGTAGGRRESYTHFGGLICCIRSGPRQADSRN